MKNLENLTVIIVTYLTQKKMLTDCLKSISKDVKIKIIENSSNFEFKDEIINDFSNVDGNPGYFSQVLNVYGRENMPCMRCSGKIKRIIQNQRATFYCSKCQH